jgi:hemerythrin superfamily protein
MSKSSIITVLKKDHDEVSALFERALATKDEARRTEIFAKISDALTEHTTFEEENIYPVLAAAKESRPSALEAVEEHGVVKKLLDDISQTSVADERWKAKVTVLAENVRHHVKEEEQKGGIFDELKELVEEDELARLAEEYLASK